MAFTFIQLLVDVFLVAGLLLVLLGRGWRRGRADAGDSAESREFLTTLQALIREMQETADRLERRLDAKRGEVERATALADDRIGKLEGAAMRAGPGEVPVAVAPRAAAGLATRRSPVGEPPPDPDPARDDLDDDARADRYRQVVDFARKGWDAAEIAKHTRLPRGEVDLLLKTRDGSADMAVLNAQGLPLQLLLQTDRNFLDLASGLSAGMTLRGRVAEVLADGKAVVNFRGINVTADLRNLSLAKGEVITVSVQDLTGTPTFRLIPNASAGVGTTGWSRPVPMLPATQVEALLDRLGLPRDGFHAAVVRLLDAYGIPPTRESAVAVKDLSARLPALFARSAPAALQTQPAEPATAGGVAPAPVPPAASASVPFLNVLDAWVRAVATPAPGAPPPPTGWAPQFGPATPFLAAFAPALSDPGAFAFVWQPVAPPASVPPAPVGSPASAPGSLPPPPAAVAPAPAPVAAAPPPTSGATTPVSVAAQGAPPSGVANPAPAASLPWEPVVPAAPAESWPPPAPSLQVALGASRGYLLGRIAAALAWEPASAPAIAGSGGVTTAPATSSWSVPVTPSTPAEFAFLAALASAAPAGAAPVSSPGPVGAAPMPSPVPLPAGTRPAVASAPAPMAPTSATTSPVAVVPIAPAPIRLSATVETLVRSADALLVRMPELSAVRELAAVISDLRAALTEAPVPPAAADDRGVPVAPAAGAASLPLRMALAPIASRIAEILGRLETAAGELRQLESVVQEPGFVPGTTASPRPAPSAAPAPVPSPAPAGRSGPSVAAAPVPAPAVPVIEPGRTAPVQPAAPAAPLTSPIRLAVAELAGLAAGVVHEVVAREVVSAAPVLALPPALPTDAGSPVRTTPVVSPPPVQAPLSAIRLPLPAADVIRILATVAEPDAVPPGTSRVPVEPARGTAQSSPPPELPPVTPAAAAVIRGDVPELAVRIQIASPDQVGLPWSEPAAAPAPQASVAVELPAVVVPFRPAPVPPSAGPVEPARLAVPAQASAPVRVSGIPESSPPLVEPVPVTRFLAVLADGIRRSDAEPAAIDRSTAPPPAVRAAPVLPGGAAPVHPVEPGIATPGHASAPVAVPPAPTEPSSSAASAAVPLPSSTAPSTFVTPGPAATMPAAAPVLPPMAAVPPAVQPPAPSFVPVMPSRPLPPPVEAVPAAVLPEPSGIAGRMVAPAFSSALPAVSLPVLETAVFMVARGLPATPATAAAAHEFLFTVPRLPAALDRFEVAAAASDPAPQPAPLRAAVERLTGLARAVRVSPEEPQFARQLQAAVERMGLAHESGLARAAETGTGPARGEDPTRGALPSRGAVATEPELPRAAVATSEVPQTVAPTARTQVQAVPAGRDTSASALPAAAVKAPSASPVAEPRAPEPARAGAAPEPPLPRPESSLRQPVPAQSSARFDAPARPEPAGRQPVAVPPRPGTAAPTPAGVPDTQSHADRTVLPPSRESAEPPAPAPRAGAPDPGLAPLRETLKAAALEVRREAIEALRQPQPPAHRQQLVALRDAAHEIVQSISSQQLGSWTARDATSVVQVQIPLALGAELRGGDIRVSWREEKNTRKRDPKIPAQMTMEIDTRSLGPVGVHLEMLGNALSLIFRVYDEGVQAFVRDELPDLVNKLTGYDYRITRADCEVDVPPPDPAAPLPARPAPTTSLDLTA